MLLNYLGFGQNLTTMGFVWYYMNILAMAGIVYMLLRLAIARAQKVTTNQSESKITEDRLFIRFVMFIATFGLVYFFMREHINDLKEIWNWAYEGIQELING